MRLLIVLLIIVVSFCSISAQDIVSIVKIDGTVCQANSLKEFEMLKTVVKTVNKLKRERSEGRLLKSDYIKNVAGLINDFQDRTGHVKPIIEYAENMNE